MAEQQKEKKKVQRIKLRIYKQPVRWDASIVDADPTGAWIDVEFDGPLPTMRLYHYGPDLLVDKELGNDRTLPMGATIWEVL